MMARIHNRLGYWLVAVLALCLVATFPHTGTAQSITINNALAFGDVFPSIPKMINKTNAGSAAEFHVAGVAGNELTVDFTLPTYMSQSGFNMQLIFRDDDCSMDSSATPDQSNPSLDDQDPWHTITYNLGLNGLTIWLGGTVVPGLMQHNGSYSASIVLTVAYTGT
jgi:hypothetical protein